MKHAITLMDNSIIHLDHIYCGLIFLPSTLNIHVIGAGNTTRREVERQASEGVIRWKMMRQSIFYISTKHLHCLCKCWETLMFACVPTVRM